jgi:hypothetical protein
MTDRDLEARWLAGDSVAASELAASMTAVGLGKFGTEALAACCTMVDAPPAVANVVQVGRADPSRAHAAFDAVRELTLRADTRSDDSGRLLLLSVAENAARVVYNSTNPDDPFDADSEECLLRSIAEFSMSLKPGARSVLARQLSGVLESMGPLRVTPSEVQKIRAAKLSTRWFAGDPEACRMLAGEMTEAQLRIFAVDVLTACCTVATEVPSAVLQVVEAGRSAPGSARVAFEAVRELRPAAEISQPVTLDARLLRVAESAARVVYNSTNPDDRFERASGEWLFQTSSSLYCALPNDVRQQLGKQLSQALTRAKAE